MKRFLLLLAVFVAMLGPLPARAEETPEVQLEFVRNLRAKHYSNLALEYLGKLSKKASPEMAPLLALETARTKVSLAQELEPEQRAALFAQARTELEAFIKAHGEHPEAPQARVEIARLAALQGKALLSAALRQEAREAQIAGALKARQQFIDAAKELEAATTQLDALKAKYATAGTAAEKVLKQKTTEGYLQVSLDRATNYLDQADTYIDEASDTTVRERTGVVEQAKKALTKIADLDTKLPEATLARAWLVRCYQLIDSPLDATKQFKRVMDEKSPSARAGKRLAWYFHIRGIPNDPGVKKDRDKVMIKEAGAWLKEFPASKNTEQGQAVRFEMDKALVAEGEALKGAAAEKYLDPARQDLALLAAGDSDIAAQAGELHLQVSVVRVKDLPLAKLQDFDDSFLKARYDMYLFQKSAAELEKKTGAAREKIEEQRKARLKEMLAALQQALRLADSKTPASQLTEARFTLAFAYLLSDDPYRAAIVGESTAKSRPSSKRSAAAAGYALQAYGTILDERNGNNDANRARLRKLADYILQDMAKVWGTDPVTSLARYQLAMVDLRERKYPETLDALEKLPPDFRGYVYSQCQLALTAFQAAKEAKTDAERRAFQERALKALKRIPNLPPHPDPTTTQYFFNAQLNQGTLLFAAANSLMQKGEVPQAVKKYEELATFTTDLLRQFEKADVKLGAEVHDALEAALGNLKKAARYGLASTEYRAGNYDKVLVLTADAVKAVKALDKGEGPIVMKDYKTTGSLLGLYLRAKVQKGAVADAKDLLPLLRRLQGENDLENDATAVLQALVQELRSQVKGLQEKAKTDPAAKERLNAMAGNFTAFLKELARQSDQKGMLQNIFFIANCYSSLAKHKEAADLFAQIAPPKDLAEAKAGASKEAATYYYIQLQRAKELRLAAKDLLSDMMAPEAKKTFAEASEVLGKIPPSFRSFAVQQEEVFQLEDQTFYGKASKRWDKLMTSPHLAKNVSTDNEAKKQYFDCFYHKIYCVYEYGKNQKGPAEQTKYIRQAASLIVRLESARPPDGWQIIGDRLRELLRVEAPLRAQYDELKKAAP